MVLEGRVAAARLVQNSGETGMSRGKTVQEWVLKVRLSTWGPGVRFLRPRLPGAVLAETQMSPRRL